MTYSNLDSRRTGLGLARQRRVPPARDHYMPGMVRLSELATADYLGVPIATLRSWRRRRATNDPRWYLHEGRIAYDVADLDVWKAARA